MKYVQLDTDADVAQFVHAGLVEFGAISQTRAYWDTCLSPSYVAAHKPLPSEGAMAWDSKKKRFVPLPKGYLPGVTVHRMAGGGALVELDDVGRGAKGFMQSWLQAQDSVTKENVRGRFLGKLLEVEGERKTVLPDGV